MDHQDANWGYKALSLQEINELMFLSTIWSRMKNPLKLAKKRVF